MDLGHMAGKDSGRILWPNRRPRHHASLVPTAPTSALSSSVTVQLQYPRASKKTPDSDNGCSVALCSIRVRIQDIPTSILIGSFKGRDRRTPGLSRSTSQQPKRIDSRTRSIKHGDVVLRHALS